MTTDPTTHDRRAPGARASAITEIVAVEGAIRDAERSLRLARNRRDSALYHAIVRLGIEPATVADITGLSLAVINGATGR